MAEVIHRCSRACGKLGWVEDSLDEAHGRNSIQCHYSFSRGNKMVLSGSHWARVVEEEEGEGEEVIVRRREVHSYHLVVEKHDLQGVHHLLSAGGISRDQFQTGFRNSLVEYRKTKFGASMRYVSQDIVEDETMRVGEEFGWYPCRCFARHEDRFSQDLPMLHHDACDLTIDLGYYTNAYTVVLHKKQNYWIQYRRFTAKSLRAINETTRKWIRAYSRVRIARELVPVNFDELDEEQKGNFPSVFGGLPF